MTVRMGGAQSTGTGQDDDAWARGAAKGARAILRAVPTATAAQVGAHRVRRGSGRATFHASGTPAPVPTPSNTAVTWSLLVQSVPGSSTHFDSFEVYVEEEEEQRRAAWGSEPPMEVILACERAALALYPRWARNGVTVRVQHAQVSGSTRRRLGARSNWSVLRGVARLYKG